MDESATELRSLKQLRVDLEELSMALENASYETDWYLDTATGEVLLISGDLYDDDDAQIAQKEEIEDDESGRYVFIPHADSRAGYEDMEWFIATVADPLFRELLQVAIRGRGAFRRFK